jgi:prepilin-type N-terminal cleavage/methylation domain-containing protein
MRRYRRAFTLLELLVVVSIIGVLLAILVPAVMAVMARGTATRNVSDIQQLSAACQTFYTRNGFYPPSRVILCDSYSDYFADPATCRTPKSPLHADSVATLCRMFPRIKGGAGAAWAAVVDWNGNGTVDGPVTLEGDQCLVFFLGGIPMTSGTTFGCQGFGKNPVNPTQAGGDRDTYFQFKSGQLANLHGNGYLSYLDAYGKVPFAYFSGYGTTNGYNRYFAAAANSDCASLGVWPYAKQLGAAPAYLNPDSCQIISAGKDGVFGPGTVLPAGAAWPGSMPLAGQDDRSNFSASPLGAN